MLALDYMYDDLIEGLSPEDVRTAECLYCNKELGVCECIPGEKPIFQEELYELVITH